MLFFVYALTRNFVEYKKNVLFYENYKKEYEKEKKNNTVLKTQLLKNSDPHEVEKTIRNKLNLLKSGEVSVIIPLPSPTPIITTPTPAPVYEQWWDSFFKN
ncbi:MAG: hypothetical protein RI947_761 [Candidatus Parcubacteria bacterium]|jgi:cell division protein FtsB